MQNIIIGKEKKIGIGIVLAGLIAAWFFLTRKAEAVPTKPYACPYCSMRFSTATERDTHVATMHPTVAVKYICSYCGAVFTTQALLNSHIATAHPTVAVKYTCPYCTATFTTQALLTAHISTAHPAEQVITYKAIDAYYQPVDGMTMICGETKKMYLGKFVNNVFSEILPIYAFCHETPEGVGVCFQRTQEEKAGNYVNFTTWLSALLPYGSSETQSGYYLQDSAGHKAWFGVNVIPLILYYKVVDNITYAGMSNAECLLEDRANPNNRIYATTDANGYVRMSVYPGAYNLFIQKPGYNTLNLYNIAGLLAELGYGGIDPRFASQDGVINLGYGSTMLQLINDTASPAIGHFLTPQNNDVVWGSPSVWTWVKSIETNPYDGVTQNISYYYLRLEDTSGIVIGSIADNITPGYCFKKTLKFYHPNFVGPLQPGQFRIANGEYIIRMVIYGAKGSWVAQDAPRIYIKNKEV